MCLITRGRLRGCRTGIAGVKAVYLANYDASIVFTETAGEITDISAITVFRYDLKPRAGSFDENIAVSIENQSVVYDQNLSMNLFGMTKDDRSEIMLMAQGDLFVFVETPNGDIFLMGRTTGAYVSGGGNKTGRNPGDMVGTTLELKADEPYSRDFIAAYTSTPFDNIANVTVTAGT